MVDIGFGLNDGRTTAPVQSRGERKRDGYARGERKKARVSWRPPGGGFIEGKGEEALAGSAPHARVAPRTEEEDSDSSAVSRWRWADWVEMGQEKKGGKKRGEGKRHVC